jgi:hypothetical protein
MQSEAWRPHIVGRPTQLETNEYVTLFYSRLLPTSFLRTGKLKCVIFLLKIAEKEKGNIHVRV